MVFEIEEQWDFPVVALSVRDSTSNEVIGQAIAEIHYDMVYLRSIGVSRLCREKGIGSALMARIEQLCEREGKYGVLKKQISVADVRSKMYENRGWKKTSQPNWLQYIPTTSIPIPLSKSFLTRIIEINTGGII